MQSSPSATLAAVTPAEADEVTSAEAARILGVSRQAIHQTPRSRLPYRESLGGVVRRGRRYYKRADVERLAGELSGGVSES